jgi:hypothetical protein
MNKIRLLMSLLLVFLFPFTLYCGTQPGAIKDKAAALRLNIEESGRVDFDKFIEFELVIEKSLKGSMLNSFLSGLAKIAAEIEKGGESKWDMKKIEKGFKAALLVVPQKNQEKFKVLFKNIVKTGMSINGSKALLNNL